MRTASGITKRVTWPIAIVGVAACILMSCGGPYTMWRGKTPGRRHAIDVVESAGRQFVRVDGDAGPRFDAVAAKSLSFSEDGSHMAYAARTNGAWHVVRDNVAGDAWDAIGELVMSTTGAHVAYSAERAGRWHLVVDKRAGSSHGEPLAGTLQFSGDGLHVAHVASEHGRARVVVDERVGPSFEGIGVLRVSRDGSHVAYVGRRGGASYVVYDGTPGKAWGAVEQLVLGDGGRIAYRAREGASTRVVWSRPGATDLTQSEPYEAARDLTISADEMHVAWIARTNGGDTVVVDGAPREGIDAAISPSTLAFRPRTNDIALIVRDSDKQTRAIVGALVGAPFDEIEGRQIVFSADGARFAYTGRRGAESVVVIDGSETYRETWASRPVLSSAGRVAYVARRNRGAVVVIDGRRHDVDVAIDGTFAFSADERHWACVAGATRDRELYFLVDGQRKASLDFEEVISASGQFSLEDVMQGRADAVLQRWAAAEANLAAAHRFVRRTPGPRPASLLRLD